MTAAPRVIYDFGTARVVDSGVSPFDGADLIVEQRKGQEWERVGSFNSLSNDYAYTSASDCARQCATRSTP